MNENGYTNSKVKISQGHLESKLRKGFEEEKDIRAFVFSSVGEEVCFTCN